MTISSLPEKAGIHQPISSRTFETVTRATPEEIRAIDRDALIHGLRLMIRACDDTIDLGLTEQEPEADANIRLARRHLELALLDVIG